VAKGYWIVGLRIKDQDKYAAYHTANAEAFHKYGARFLARVRELLQRPIAMLV